MFKIMCSNHGSTTTILVTTVASPTSNDAYFEKQQPGQVAERRFRNKAHQATDLPRFQFLICYAEPTNKDCFELAIVQQTIAIQRQDHADMPRTEPQWHN